MVNSKELLLKMRLKYLRRFSDLPATSKPTEVVSPARDGRERFRTVVVERAGVPEVLALSTGRCAISWSSIPKTCPVECIS